MKELIKNILSQKNPIAIIRRKKMRKELSNYTPSFLCPNCLGGILFHDLGLKFYSPTVNLMMTQKDFVKFVLNLEEFLRGSLNFFEHEIEKCPCAWLKTETGKKVVIHFTHYGSEEEAMEKWNSRITRINKDNLFVCLMERDQLTKEEIIALGELKLKGLVVFTAKKYEDIPYTLHIPEYEKVGEVGNLLVKNYIDDSRYYEKYFDFVKWFNESDGLNFDVSKFAK